MNDIAYRPITKEEWDQYDWINVTTFQDQIEGRIVYIRGRRHTLAPDDGYVYEECTRMIDREQKWRRVVTPLNKE